MPVRRDPLPRPQRRGAPPQGHCCCSFGRPHGAHAWARTLGAARPRCTFSTPPPDSVPSIERPSSDRHLFRAAPPRLPPSHHTLPFGDHHSRPARAPPVALRHARRRRGCQAPVGAGRRRRPLPSLGRTRAARVCLEGALTRPLLQPPWALPSSPSKRIDRHTHTQHRCLAAPPAPSPRHHRGGSCHSTALHLHPAAMVRSPPAGGFRSIMVQPHHTQALPALSTPSWPLPPPLGRALNGTPARAPPARFPGPAQRLPTRLASRQWASMGSNQGAWVGAAPPGLHTQHCFRPPHSIDTLSLPPCRLLPRTDIPSQNLVRRPRRRGVPRRAPAAAGASLSPLPKLARQGRRGPGTAPACRAAAAHLALRGVLGLSTRLYVGARAPGSQPDNRPTLCPFCPAAAALLQPLGRRATAALSPRTSASLQAVLCDRSTAERGPNPPAGAPLVSI